MGRWQTRKKDANETFNNGVENEQVNKNEEQPMLKQKNLKNQKLTELKNFQKKVN